ncbi:hypothetical protein H0X09_03620 [Candidatus Saccharibacteria bacterium]|nr:hypothetical protein [Candidatus Saccharibacteria bacterium]
MSEIINQPPQEVLSDYSMPSAEEITAVEAMLEATESIIVSPEQRAKMWNVVIDQIRAERAKGERG